MNTHLVSIIVPVYNVEKFLEQCLQSLINQSYQKLDIILINDGSTDRSLSICQKYAMQDDRIKLFDQANKGASVARNIGLENARGDYILYVDSDDFIVSDTVEILLQSISREDSDICIFEKLYWYYDEKNKKTFELTRNYQHFSKPEVLLVDDIHLFSPCTKMYKKSLLEGIDFPEQLLHEDVFHWIAVLAKQPKISLAVGSSYYYRKTNQQSVTKIGNNMITRKKHLAQSFRLGVEFAEENQVNDDFKLALLYAFCLFFPSPSPHSLEDEKYIVEQLTANVAAYKKLPPSRASLIEEYRHTFRWFYLDNRKLRVNLLPKLRRSILQFSIELGGFFEFTCILGRAKV